MNARTHSIPTRAAIRLVAPRSKDRAFAYVATGIQRSDSDSVDWRPIKEPIPTTHFPGTRGKVEVMRRRRENREQLFHDQDAGRKSYDLD